MLKRSAVLVMATLLAAGAACKPARHSPASFRLPEGGSVERGRQAFAELGCASCHTVAGTDLPRPNVQPPVPVTLGGEVDAKLSDAYLATAMINPSYHFAPYPKDQIAQGGVSRMPAYADRLTVRQMTDLVAFLQSRYVVRRTLPTYAYR